MYGPHVNALNIYKKVKTLVVPFLQTVILESYSSVIRKTNVDIFIYMKDLMWKLKCYIVSVFVSVIDSL